LNRARRYVPVSRKVAAASSSSSSEPEVELESEPEVEESPGRVLRRGRRGKRESHFGASGRTAARRGIRASAAASGMVETGHEIRGAGEEVPLFRLDKGKQRATVQHDGSTEDGDVLMEKVCHFPSSSALPNYHPLKCRSASENLLWEKANARI